MSRALRQPAASAAAAATTTAAAPELVEQQLARTDRKSEDVDWENCDILLRQVDDAHRHGESPRQLQKRHRSTSDTRRNSENHQIEEEITKQQQQSQYSSFAVPTVSVAAYSDDENQTKKSRQKHGDDAESPASSCARSATSEVDSLDGAQSIASRLSQIVDEQEFLMRHAEQADGDRSRNVSAARAATHSSSGGDGGDGGGAVAQPLDSLLSARQHTSNGEIRAVSLQRPEELARARLDALIDGQMPAESGPTKLLRNRTKSFASIQHNGAAHNATASPRRLAERRNESSGSISPSGGFNPERGDLRALKQTPASNRASRDRLNSTELMLNIRRSAWKLDEFDRAFKPAEPELELASGGAPSIMNDQDGVEPDRKSATPFQRQGSSSSGKRNFLARASRRLTPGGQRPSNVSADFQQVSPLAASASATAMAVAKSPVGQLLSNNRRRFSHSDSSHNLHFNQQQQQQPATQIHTNQSAAQQMRSASSKNLLSASSGLKLNELHGQRRNSGNSMASFASSFDSTRRSSHPFGRLGSLLSGSARDRDDAGGAAANDGDDDRQCSPTSLRQYAPVLEWLPVYNWRDDFLADLTAGLVVAVLNISTSLSAAVVAETELGAAFRTSIFNTFVYAILCSSRHSSFGSWSIMSQMLLDSVRRALGDELILSRINLGPQASWTSEDHEMWHMNIIIMYTFLIGLVQLLAGVLNLGNILASFIPETLCSSMIAATAFTMSVGQLAHMCGTSNKVLWAIEKNTTELAWADFKQPVSITDLFAGLFTWIQQIALLIKHYEQINTIACLISLVTVIVLLINQVYLQNKLSVWFKKDNLFIPFELILLIMWICVAHALQLRDKYHVATCGPIFIEFNMPNVPNLRLVRELWLDSLATALISYTMVFIMAKTYSNKFNYEINANQELIACGAGNLIGGLFNALPATASFSRTAGQVEAGGRTQMASLVNCVTLFVLAHYLGHHFAHLPVCVMSATLFFGFARMMTRARDALVYWRLCKLDFVMWFFNFCAIITFDLVNGFVYGFIFSLLTMLYRAQSRRCYMLGSIGNTDVYVPLPKYPLARELDGIKIFQFCGPIHYVCADLFERLLRRKTRVNVKELFKQLEERELQQRQKAALDNSVHPESGGGGGKIGLSRGATSVSTINGGQTRTIAEAISKQFNPRDMNLPTHIILDFSMISNLDTAGLRTIKKIIVDYQRVNITIMLASLASHVAQTVKNDPSLWDAHKDRFYLTLADAVHHALRDNGLVMSPAGFKLG